ncbi:hypothetical protein M8998_04270 [Sphingobacterium sp. lm-10]|uniref:hypothetical protein n=1 Tax=Sphingobacterium sp. lm-10 TaxID=2944904 RepID=UPI00202037DE|nr:hypothetical protein [Sphingobacterium sp. lm-10]MCL7987153.1 hypothetical protein [Sphingobacterium sp. lm-10]
MKFFKSLIYPQSIYALAAALLLITGCKKDEPGAEENQFCSSLSTPVSDLTFTNTVIYEKTTNNQWWRHISGRSEVVEGCRLRIVRQGNQSVYYNLEKLFKYEHITVDNQRELRIYFD